MLSAFDNRAPQVPIAVWGDRVTNAGRRVAHVSLPRIEKTPAAGAV